MRRPLQSEKSHRPHRHPCPSTPRSTSRTPPATTPKADHLNSHPRPRAEDAERTSHKRTSDPHPDPATPPEPPPPPAGKTGPATTDRIQDTDLQSFGHRRHHRHRPHQHRHPLPTPPMTTERSSDEYRTPTEEEWDAFVAHFEKRKVSLAPALVPFQALVFVNTLAFVARSSGRTRPNAAGWRRSATTSSPAPPRRSTKAGSAKSKDSGSAWLAPKTSSLKWADELPEARRSTSVCHAYPQPNPSGRREQLR